MGQLLRNYGTILYIDLTYTSLTQQGITLWGKVVATRAQMDKKRTKSNDILMVFNIGNVRRGIVWGLSRLSCQEKYAKTLFSVPLNMSSLVYSDCRCLHYPGHIWRLWSCILLHCLCSLRRSPPGSGDWGPADLSSWPRSRRNPVSDVLIVSGFGQKHLPNAINVNVNVNVNARTEGRGLVWWYSVCKSLSKASW